jgi:RNA polymerase sigma-70 factor (ECF subfamily)
VLLRMPSRAEAPGSTLRRSSSPLEDLYTTYAGQAFRLAYLLTGNRDTADDLAQDAFVRAASRFHHLRDPGSFDRYLRRTVVNLARSHWRRRQVERRYLTRERHRPPPLVQMPDTETRDTLWDLLQKLPVHQRAALVLRYYEDLSERQTAAILGVSTRAASPLIAALRAPDTPDR